MDETPFRFNRNEGLMVLQFPKGFERQYENHLELVRHLQQANAYPRLDVGAYVAAGPAASLARFIALAGSASEIAKVEKVFYDPRAEAFVASRFANDWNAISPQSSLSNVAAHGCSVDIAGLETNLRVLEEGIAARHYEKAAEA